MLPESPVADEDDALMSGSPKSTLETTASGADAATPVPRTFFSLLAIYVAPLSWALLREGVYTADRQDLPAYLSPYATVEGLVAWLGVNVALYGAQRAVAARRGWKMNEKHAATHKEDLLRMCVLSGLLFLAGRVGARVAADPLVFFAWLAFFTFGYGVLFELLRHANIELTRDCVRNVHTLALMAFTASIVGGLLANHLALAAARNATRAPGDAPFSAAQALGLAAFVVGGHGLLVVAPGDTAAHFHHWYTGFVGSCFCVFDSDVSQIAHAMLLGIYLHGAALFGVERCFYPADHGHDARLPL
mmetsp:Transcript_36218/g.122640  ORF Transcript_36218/g.122640 Transcript_36218/m.122640 type:complete len:304 (+) Transcript_36218:61-972(+)